MTVETRIAEAENAALDFRDEKTFGVMWKVRKWARLARCLQLNNAKLLTFDEKAELLGLTSDEQVLAFLKGDFPNTKDKWQPSEPCFLYRGAGGDMYVNLVARLDTAYRPVMLTFTRALFSPSDVQSPNLPIWSTLLPLSPEQQREYSLYPMTPEARTFA